MPGLSAALYAACVHSGLAAALRRRDAAPIFCFHNVVADALSGLYGDRSLHIGASHFADLVEWISSRFTVTPLSELVERLRAHRSVRGAACFTFDDAYCGALAHAAPVLKRRRLPATVFIVANAAERPRPFWWDSTAFQSTHERDRYLRELSGDGDRIPSAASGGGEPLPGDLLPAGWASLKSVLDGDLVPGSHTMSHRNLSSLSVDEVHRELRESRERITDRLGTDVTLLSYPYGFVTRSVMDASVRAGFDGAVTLGFGSATSSHHLHALPRINVPSTLSTRVLECWASGVRLRAAPIRLRRDRVETIPSGRPTDI